MLPKSKGVITIYSEGKVVWVPKPSKLRVHDPSGQHKYILMWIFSRGNCVSFFQIALKLTQMQGPSREFRQPLLDVIIRNMHADVVDRKWDTQGSVTMGTITVLDYITVGTYVYSHPKTLHSVYDLSSLSRLTLRLCWRTHLSAKDWGTKWWQLHLNKICHSELHLHSPSCLW